MTKKLYYTDSYKTNFNEKIISKTKFLDKYAVVLEETYFYPTTGGQEHDIGSINGVDVIDVVEYNDQILHLTQKEITGDIAECTINWKRRFDFMQQHTGQHVLSESIFKLSGYNTVSSHLGEESSTISTFVCGNFYSPPFGDNAFINKIKTTATIIPYFGLNLNSTFPKIVIPATIEKTAAISTTAADMSLIFPTRALYSG